ncbi:hypothetical protein HOY82DRAFT_554002 [Tuber indicum]|nr:hypothetical protein HOY82DRAFT_554002 [Tuber indicum]
MFLFFLFIFFIDLLFCASCRRRPRRQKLGHCSLGQGAVDPQRAQQVGEVRMIVTEIPAYCTVQYKYSTCSTLRDLWSLVDYHAE